MPLAQLVEARQRILQAAAACTGGDAEERVGHAAHRGHDDSRPATVPRARRLNNVNQSLNGFGIGDRGAAEFLDNHKEQILYGKAGVPRRAWELAVAVFVFLRNQAIVAAKSRDDLAVPSIQFVHLFALAIEGCNGLFVVVP